jgi:hypothetical protein
MALGCPPASRARLRTPQLQQASTRAAVVVVWALPQTMAHPCCLYLRAERATHFEETIESAHEIRWGWDYLGLAASFPISRHRGRAGSIGGRRPGCGHCGVWWPSRRWDYLRYVSPSFHGEHEHPEIDGHQLGHHRSSPQHAATPRGNPHHVLPRPAVADAEMDEAERGVDLPAKEFGPESRV